MRLDRNTHPEKKHGKYALVLMRSFPKEGSGEDCQLALDTLKNEGHLDFGTEPDKEFFVLRLRDKHAHAALSAYAMSILADDPQMAAEVALLALKSLVHPNRHSPD